jgi:hypothetical protein
MLQSQFQISSHHNAMYAIGNVMPGMQSFITLPKNCLGNTEKREDLRNNEQHKRPWYTHTLRY